MRWLYDLVWANWAHRSLFLIIASAQVFILLERLFPYDKGQRLFRKGWFTDFVMYTIVQSYLLGLVINGLIQWIDNTSGASRLHLVSNWPVPLQLFFFFIT